MNKQDVVLSWLLNAAARDLGSETRVVKGVRGAAWSIARRLGDSPEEAAKFQNEVESYVGSLFAPTPGQEITELDADVTDFVGPMTVHSLFCPTCGGWVSAAYQQIANHEVALMCHACDTVLLMVRTEERTL